LCADLNASLPQPSSLSAYLELNRYTESFTSTYWLGLEFVGQNSYRWMFQGTPLSEWVRDTRSHCNKHPD